MVLTQDTLQSHDKDDYNITGVNVNQINILFNLCIILPVSNRLVRLRYR